MTQRTTVLCTNSISSMVFVVRPRLLLKTRLLLEQRQSDPWLVFETRLLLEEIQYGQNTVGLFFRYSTIRLARNRPISKERRVDV